MTGRLALALALAAVACRKDAAPAAAPAPGAAAPDSSAGRKVEGRDVLTIPRPAGAEWFGLYLVGKKAGHAWLEVRRETRGGREVLVAMQETEISATLGYQSVKRAQRDEKVYEARPGGRLLSFRSTRDGDGGKRSVAGSCDPSGCTLLLETEGGREERRIPDPGETAEQADAARLAAALGTAVRGPQLDPEQLRVKRMTDEVRGRRRLAGAGVEVEVAVVEEREEGDRAALEVLVAGDGRIAEMRLGGSVVARAEPEAVARRLDRVDLFNLTRVSLPGPLPRAVPGAVRYRLRGLPDSFRVGDDRQFFEPGPGGDALLTVTALVPRAADPARDAPRRQGSAGGAEAFLGPSVETVGDVDSDTLAIRELADRVAGSERGAYAAARRLNQEVYRRLEKSFGQSHDRASEVLSSGKGDCTEHALLLVALCRAAGIPARAVYGLVYARYGDGADALYWHAWAEVRSGREWIAMDPTFGQDVADATHLLLGRGVQLDAVALLGTLKVVWAEARPPRRRG